MHPIVRYIRTPQVRLAATKYGANKRGHNSKVHLAVDANGMPVRVAVTSGTVADCKQAIALIDGLFADYLLADKDYDTNEIIKWAIEHGMITVIPPKKNRIDQREYDGSVNAFLKPKQWRGIATRVAKTPLLSWLLFKYVVLCCGLVF